VPASGARPATIEGDTWACQIEMKPLSKKYSGRIREAARHAREQGGKLFEAGALGFIFSMGRFVGAGEVAHNQAQIEGSQQFGHLRELPQVVGWQAEPCHSCIDMDRGGQTLAARLTKASPFGNFAEAA